MITPRLLMGMGVMGLLLPFDGAEAQSQNADTSPAAQVLVVRAKNACFSLAIPVTGVLVARSEAVLTLSPGDKVVEVLSREGDAVAADQTLARVTRPSREPPRPGVQPKNETVALKAPAAGVVIRTSASVGATPSPMQTEPLFRIAVDNELELEAEVPSIHVPELSPGQPARVLIGSTRELFGRVRLVPAAIDPNTQLGRARISIEGSSQQLRVAARGRAIIDARRSCGISIPSSTVTYGTGGTSVQVVHNNVIETRSVQTGLSSDTDTEITTGLNDGEIVVANAGTSLRDGDRVRAFDVATLGSER